MIYAATSDNYKNITKVSILDSKRVFYPMKYVMEKRDISFDEDLAIVIKPIPEDIKYPSDQKVTASGTIFGYKIEISINNQSKYTEEQLFSFVNKKVIVVLHHNDGKIIIGCNEMPLTFSFGDDNTTNPASNSGYTILCTGNVYFPKVST